jgi:2-succinyl-6-hydroxy-2,4-cyclohexadiene-1-carboxylate synthase
LIEHVDVDVGDDLRLHVASSGQGPALVMLHGFTGSATTWDFLRPVLEERHRLIAVDLPGHGRSSSPSDPGRYSLDRLAVDLSAILDSIEVERAAIMGYSMGGRAALRFAIARPNRISALILESTSPGLSDAAERDARATSDALLADAIERDGVEAFVSRWERLPLWQSQRAMPDAGRKALREQRLANNARGLANSLRGSGSGAYQDVLNVARGIASPALIIAGGLDTKYVELGRELAHAIPTATLQIVDNCGHAVHLEKPDVFAASIGSFLAAIPAA